MKFLKSEIEDLIIIQIEKNEDQRGYFARTWDKKIFEVQGLNSNLVQCNTSFSKKAGTLRGMHFQDSPFEEIKLVRCTKGKIFDVIIDLRPKSLTFKKWVSIELSEKNLKMVYVPEGCAHGFQTLEDNSEVFYQVSQFYSPQHENGIRWNDPTFQIKWPLHVVEISEKDKTRYLFTE